MPGDLGCELDGEGPCEVDGEVCGQGLGDVGI